MRCLKVRKPKDLNETFLGTHITAYPTADDVRNRTNGQKLFVSSIKGNLTHQTMFEINGSHLVSMLDAYSEINKEPVPNLDLHRDFLSTVAEHVVETRPTSLIERGPKLVQG